MADSLVSTRTGGSSPRVLGKLGLILDEISHGRLIPARAGKTQRQARRPHPRAAHPRACGENHFSMSFLQPFTGSSPRVRGKQGVAVGAARGVGLIPARAGKT